MDHYMSIPIVFPLYWMWFKASEYPFGIFILCLQNCISQNTICMNNDFIYSLSMWLTWTSLTHLDYCKDVVKGNWSRQCRHTSFEHELRIRTPKYSNHNITGGFVLGDLVLHLHCIYVIYHPGSSFFAKRSVCKDLLRCFNYLKSNIQCLLMLCIRISLWQFIVWL